MDIREQIERLRDGSIPLAYAVNFKAANSLENLLAVYEDALKIKPVPDGVTDNTPILQLQFSLAAVKIRQKKP